MDYKSCYNKVDIFQLSHRDKKETCNDDDNDRF